ncbi:MAG: HRDC domain-containing protein [Desulfobacterales bacterium]|jgi:ribonuclease D|nr:HRDC domain-containing protein [Desulfobacterales bacterium]
MDSDVKDKYQNKYPYRPENPVDKKNNHFFIEKNQDFKQAIDRLRTEPCIALDLEADSMFHFREKICLIQMADRQHIYIIDPLSIQDMSPLAQVVSNPGILKIIHGADYDIRSIYRDYQITIENLFDTELAARLLGYSETGLDSLLKHKFNVTLEKKFQKKDWSRRPLQEDMIAYAANDVRYLIPLRRQQMDELSEKGRMDWLLEECALLTKVRNNAANDSPLFARVKGAGRLDQKGLALLESLLQYRLQVAAQKDRPPFKIIGTPSLMKIAQERPATLKQLKEMDVLSEKQFNIHAKAFIEMICAVLNLPKHKLPRYPYKSSFFPDNAISAQIKKLKIWRQHKADLLKIDSGVLLNNSALRAVAGKSPKSMDELFAVDEMKTWQKKEFGEEIIGILSKTHSNGYSRK